VAARRLGRRSIGIELNSDYAEMATLRLEMWWRNPVYPKHEIDETQQSLFA
jgi:DNA modification methylase